MGKFKESELKEKNRKLVAALMRERLKGAQGRIYAGKPAPEGAMPEKQKVHGLQLMWYACPSCGARERLWNSRPRVTPFFVSCRECDESMQHTGMHLDEFAPNHEPQAGERVFIDWSKESAALFYHEMVEESWGRDDMTMSEVYDTKEEAFNSLMESWQFGEPTIETI